MCIAISYTCAFFMLHQNAIINLSICTKFTMCEHRLTSTKTQYFLFKWKNGDGKRAENWHAEIFSADKSDIQRQKKKRSQFQTWDYCRICYNVMDIPSKQERKKIACNNDHREK